MWNIVNLEGTIMLQDIPICDFSIEHSEVVYLKILNNTVSMPYEFREGINKSSLYDFLLWRLPEPNRQDLQEECKKYNVRCFADDILKFNNGSVIDDDYWIKYSNGVQTWEDLRTKIGFTC